MFLHYIHLFPLYYKSQFHSFTPNDDLFSKYSLKGAEYLKVYVECKVMQTSFFHQRIALDLDIRNNLISQLPKLPSSAHFSNEKEDMKSTFLLQRKGESESKVDVRRELNRSWHKPPPPPTPPQQ